MTVVFRKLFIFALAAAALLSVGCGNPPGPGDSGTGGGAGDTCIEDVDCPDPLLFFCNTVTSKCEPACRSKDQCTAAVRGEYALDYCNGSLGCQCDEGKCVASLCSADVDCGATSVCRNGACVTAPAASTVASCRITPDYVVTRVGAKVKFHVSAWDANNAPVIIKEGATWSALGSGLSGSGNGNDVEMTGASATNTAVDSVQAAFGSVTCKAKALVLADSVPANSVAVVVIDELTSRPVPTAKLMVTNSAGAVVQQSGSDTKDSDSNGYAVLDITGNTTVSISAFHADYTYLTIANYTPGTNPILAMVVRRNQLDKYGGYKGTFNNVPATSNVHAALAGMSIAGAITSISLDQLIGPSVPTDIKIGNAIDQKDVPIPAGAYLGFTDQQIKTAISGMGLAGTCVNSSGDPDEAKITAGTCGTRTAWALAGDVPLGDLPIDAVAGGLDNIDIGALLARIIPIFKKFNSSVVRDVQFDLKATPGASTGNPDFSDVSTFTTADHDFTQIPLAFSFAVKTPELPKYKGAYADGVLVLGGAGIPGQGVVPLGIGVGVNTQPADGQVDKQADLPAAGMIQVRMAPTHHGIEGDSYGMIVAALSAKALTDASAGLGASAIYARVADNKLVFDPKGATPTDLSAGSFPPFPEGAKYNYTDAAQGALTGRTLKFASNAGLTGTQVVRITFSDTQEHRWDILCDPATATAGLTLPKPPSPLADRTFANGMSTGNRAPLVVQVMRLTANGLTSGTAVTFKDLVELNGTNFDTLTDQLTGFGFIDYGVPAVEFTSPKDNPATVAAGSNIVVQTSHFKVGTAGSDDGVVKLTFRTGGNPVSVCPDVTLSTETTAGNGELSHTLPTGCVGSGLSVKAQLFDPTGTTGLLPEVSATSTITIQ